MAEWGPPRLAADFVKAGANKAEVLKTLWPDMGSGQSDSLAGNPTRHRHVSYVL